jgi:hypothetical protein
MEKFCCSLKIIEIEEKSFIGFKCLPLESNFD